MNAAGWKMLRLGCVVMAMACAGVAMAQGPHTFVEQGDKFLMDGQPFQVVSGEIHYARIPREYWKARMEMAKAMGLNTIATYVFWNAHEPEPGVYDFSGNLDLGAFLKLAQEEGLHVLLRAGPYSCAEWEMGGFPSWLLRDPKMSKALRTNDPAFMVPVERWIKRLAKETAPYQIGRGGPVIAVQVENEYGNFGNEPGYMAHMKGIFQAAGYTDAMLYTVDPSKSLAKGALPGVFSGVNFGTGNAGPGLKAEAAFRPGEPLFATEYWPGWFDHWGHPHETRPIDAQVKDLEYILGHGGSVNIYMFHGGTSFGFMAGASWIANEYLPDVTSYDYDAPLDEAGHVTPKFLAYRDVILKYTHATALPLPEPPPVIAVGAFPVLGMESLWDKLPAPRMSEKPLTMEAVGQAYGYILYRTKLKAAADGPLVLTEVQDYAQVFVDGVLVGTVDRRVKEDRVMLKAKAGARLDILVANDGRINSTKMMRGEVKGITQGVTLEGKPLLGWAIYSLPMKDVAMAQMRPPAKATSSIAGMVGPHYGFGVFDVQRVGDTFLDVSALGKGALWINGHAVGRFWNEGPQKTLFVPGPWLKRGRNELVVFDMVDASSAAPMLEGKTTPVLNAKTRWSTQGTTAAKKEVIE
jgi:beta-galactosidase